MCARERQTELERSVNILSMVESSTHMYRILHLQIVEEVEKIPN